MSYLLDKKIKRKKTLYAVFGILICLILFYFRISIFNALSFVSHTVFHPVLIIGGNVGEKLGSIGSYFSFKSSLYLDNKNLKAKLSEDEVRMSNYNSVLADNISLREILGRKNEKVNVILSAILAKPNQSPYDTLVVDVGLRDGAQTGETVFALGNVPIGRISDVYLNSAKVVLFSSAEEKTQAVVSGKNIFIEVIGRGGGNFEMIVPRDLALFKGDQVVLPGIIPYVLAEVVTIISDPRDPFIKALLVSPVNIQDLKFVEVEIKK